jgi:hypothetical protein
MVCVAAALQIGRDFMRTQVEHAPAELPQDLTAQQGEQLRR